MQHIPAKFRMVACSYRGIASLLFLSQIHVIKPLRCKSELLSFFFYYRESSWHKNCYVILNLLVRFQYVAFIRPIISVAKTTLQKNLVRYSVFLRFPGLLNSGLVLLIREHTLVEQLFHMQLLY